MAKVTKKAAPKRKRSASRRKVTNVSNTRALKVAAEHAKFTGYEPEWDPEVFDEDARKMELIHGLGWYNYHFGTKDAAKLIIQYLTDNDRKKSVRFFKKAPDGTCPNYVAWLCRMSVRGWPLNEDEQAKIDAGISKAVERGMLLAEEAAEEEEGKPKGKMPTIQDRMREKAAEAGGELEGLLDEYVAAGAKAKHNFQPIGVLKTANILPQHVPDMVEHWNRVADEFREAYAGKDKDLKEAYDRFSKIQLRNLVKFAELMISDLQSYVTYKKATKAPRKRKVKTPEQLTVKLRYAKSDEEYGLTSVKPAKIVGSKEMFVFSPKKRKLQYYVADEHAGGELTVKNNTIVGFDPNKTVAKTLRRPVEQLKQLMAASKPNSRKFFGDIKAVETKLSGRFADDLIILKVW